MKHTNGSDSFYCPILCLVNKQANLSNPSTNVSKLSATKQNPAQIIKLYLKTQRSEAKRGQNNQKEMKEEGRESIEEIVVLKLKEGHKCYASE